MGNCPHYRRVPRISTTEPAVAFPQLFLVATRNYVVSAHEEREEPRLQRAGAKVLSPTDAFALNPEPTPLPIRDFRPQG